MDENGLVECSVMEVLDDHSCLPHSVSGEVLIDCSIVEVLHNLTSFGDVFDGSLLGDSSVVEISSDFDLGSDIRYSGTETQRKRRKITASCVGSNLGSSRVSSSMG